VRIHAADTDVYDTRVGVGLQHQMLYVISLLLTFYCEFMESRMRLICDYSWIDDVWPVDGTSILIGNLNVCSVDVPRGSKYCWVDWDQSGTTNDHHLLNFEKLLDSYITGGLSGVRWIRWWRCDKNRRKYECVWTYVQAKHVIAGKADAGWPCHDAVDIVQVLRGALWDLPGEMSQVRWMFND
jgi:hypothetical protein